MFVSVSIWNAVAVRDARACVCVWESDFVFFRIDREKEARENAKENLSERNDVQIIEQTLNLMCRLPTAPKSVKTLYPIHSAKTFA